jgi:two-component system, chemotaxis family, protein-glutamate methylesterase/glutaminase
VDPRDPGAPDAPGRVVGIGASAGGVDALIRVVAEMPPDFGAAICVVLHLPSSGRSLLAPILSRHTDLEVVQAEDGQPLRSGHVYVAPNDRHLMLADGRLQLDRGPKENGVRPAVDVMLRTLAAAYGPRSIAVILSGALGDGAAGALAVRHAGGLVVIQDPDDATVASMPESALRAVGDPDAVLEAAEIGREVARLVEPVVIGEHAPVTQAENPLADSAALPDDAMVVEQGSAVEAALWSALEAEMAE